MARRFDGKVAMVTGGCSGIGLATVLALVAEGADVIVADLQDASEELKPHMGDGSIQHVRCNVCDEGDIIAAMKLAEARGGLDILFNNAGAPGVRAGVESTEVGDWDKTLALMLRAPMLGMKHAAPLLRTRGGGAIINTASIAGLEAGWGSLAYAVAKAGVIHMSQVAAVELATDNIRVNAISPGFVLTPILANTIGRPAEDAAAVMAEFESAAAATQPLRRPCRPEDIARTVLYLASDDAAFVTATNHVVDGGVTAGQRSAWDKEMLTPLRKRMNELESSARR